MYDDDDGVWVRLAAIWLARRVLVWRWAITQDAHLKNGRTWLLMPGQNRVQLLCRENGVLSYESRGWAIVVSRNVHARDARDLSVFLARVAGELKRGRDVLVEGERETAVTVCSRAAVYRRRNVRARIQWRAWTTAAGQLLRVVVATAAGGGFWDELRGFSVWRVGKNACGRGSSPMRRAWFGSVVARGRVAAGSVSDSGGRNGEIRHPPHARSRRRCNGLRVIYYDLFALVGGVRARACKLRPSLLRPFLDLTSSSILGMCESQQHTVDIIMHIIRLFVLHAIRIMSHTVHAVWSRRSRILSTDPGRVPTRPTHKCRRSFLSGPLDITLIHDLYSRYVPANRGPRIETSPSVTYTCLQYSLETQLNTSFTTYSF